MSSARRMRMLGLAGFDVSAACNVDIEVNNIRLTEMEKFFTDAIP
jgi:hypothetical protein